MYLDGSIPYKVADLSLAEWAVKTLKEQWNCTLKPDFP